MKTIDRLVAEHNIIERGLDVLEKAAGRIDSGKSIPDEFPAWAAAFFAEFADKCHHAKEEDILFPMLKERGIPEEGGPIGVMLHEHDIGRSCVRRMRESSEGNEFDGTMFSAAAKEFIPLLRQHIFKENNILFRMAANVLSETDDANMNDKFSEVERRRELIGLHDRYDREVAGWEEDFK